ncbi:GIP [Symbiodinium sp. KB8]|nr:GIP [Symbiodinium sp. KB8]
MCAADPIPLDLLTIRDQIKVETVRNLVELVDSLEDVEEAHWLMSHEEQLIGRLKATVERMLQDDPDLSVISMFHFACHACNSAIQNQSGYSPFRGAIPADMVPEGANPFQETPKFREQASVAYRRAQAADQMSKLNNLIEEASAITNEAAVYRMPVTLGLLRTPPNRKFMFQLVDGNMMITGSSRATGKMENPHEEKDLRGETLFLLVEGHPAAQAVKSSAVPSQDQLKGHRAKRPELNIEIKAHPLLLLMKEKSLVVWSLGLQLLAHLFQVPPLLAVFFLEAMDESSGYVFETEMTGIDWKQLIGKPRQSTAWMSKKLLEKGKEVHWRTLTTRHRPRRSAMSFRNAAARSLLTHEKEKLDWKRVMKMRWVLRYKSAGPAKARLVVLGFQAPTLVETQASSPFYRSWARCCWLTIVANNRCVLESADVASAFLQAIGVKSSTSKLGAAYGGSGQEDLTVLKLHRAFYGLCHAPRQWFVPTVAEALKSAEWTEFDKCLFILSDPTTGRLVAIAGCHVDDFILGGDRQNQVFMEAKEKLRNAFEWGKWDEPSFEFAGCNVLHKPDGAVFLDQQVYTEKWMEEIPLSTQLAWRANQVSLQLLAEIGLMLSDVPTPTVDLIMRINKLVRDAKRTADQVMLDGDWVHIVAWRSQEDMTYLVRSVRAEIHGLPLVRGRLEQTVKENTTGVLVMDGLSGSVAFIRLVHDFAVENLFLWAEEEEEDLAPAWRKVMEGSTDAHSGTHEIGIVRAASSDYDPKRQLFADDALKQEWASFYDLIPSSDAPFLHATDGRRPLSLKELKEFVTSDQVEVLGLGREDRLCTAIPNGPEAAVCFFAFALRCTFAPLNIGLSRDEFEFEFTDLPAKAGHVM